MAGKSKGNAPMPSCNRRDQQKILDVIAGFRGKARAEAEALLKALGPKELCAVLHSIRRWYTNQTGQNAKRVLKNRVALAAAMDLRPPVGAYRGFKVSVGSDLTGEVLAGPSGRGRVPLAELQEGDRVRIPVTRNGGCSSWTASRAIPNKFSGASADKVGLVVRLVGARGVKTFLAPPEASEAWFNRLYTLTMSGSHRNTEREYAICSSSIEVEVVQVKRRGTRVTLRKARPRPPEKKKAKQHRRRHARRPIRPVTTWPAQPPGPHHAYRPGVRATAAVAAVLRERRV